MEGKAFTFNQVKYFGVTLDEVLIKFDTNQLRKEATKQYPTFFRPSFLLNRLIKMLPVKTDNYKKAFIKAVSARGFYRDSKKSNEIIKIVSYLRTLGIDNEDIILNLISEKLFLDDYHKQQSLDSFEENAFFESALNRLYSEKVKEAEAVQIKASELESQKTTSEEEKGKLKSQLNEANKEKELYLDGLSKLKRKVGILEKKVESPSIIPQLNFEASEKDNRIKQLESDLKTSKNENVKRENSRRKILRDQFYEKELSKWRLKSILEVMVCSAIFIGAILYMLYISQWQPKKGLEEFESLNKNLIVTALVWVASVIFNTFYIKGLYDKYRNHSNITNYKNSLQIPDELKDIS